MHFCAFESDMSMQEGNSLRQRTQRNISQQVTELHSSKKEENAVSGSSKGLLLICLSVVIVIIAIGVLRIYPSVSLSFCCTTESALHERVHIRPSTSNIRASARTSELEYHGGDEKGAPEADLERNPLQSKLLWMAPFLRFVHLHAT